MPQAAAAAMLIRLGVLCPAEFGVPQRGTDGNVGNDIKGKNQPIEQLSFRMAYVAKWSVGCPSNDDCNCRAVLVSYCWPADSSAE